MKVLVLGSRIPYPLHDGGAKASYQLLKTLANLGHEITFFSFNTKKTLCIQMKSLKKNLVFVKL